MAERKAKGIGKWGKGNSRKGKKCGKQGAGATPPIELATKPCRSFDYRAQPSAQPSAQIVPK